MKDTEYITELEAIVCALAWHYRQARNQGYTPPNPASDLERFVEDAVQPQSMIPRIDASVVPIAEFSERFFGGAKGISEDILDNKTECIAAVQRWRHYMRPLITIMSEEDGILLRFQDVGRMLLACENGSQ